MQGGDYFNVFSITLLHFSYDRGEHSRQQLMQSAPHMPHQVAVPAPDLGPHAYKRPRLSSEHRPELTQPLRIDTRIEVETKKVVYFSYPIETKQCINCLKPSILICPYKCAFKIVFNIWTVYSHFYECW